MEKDMGKDNGKDMGKNYGAQREKRMKGGKKIEEKRKGMKSVRGKSVSRPGECTMEKVCTYIGSIIEMLPTINIQDVRMGNT